MGTAAATEIDVRARWPGIILIGALTGLLSGLLGIGGAAILVPGMVDLLGMSQHRATGTSLLALRVFRPFWLAFWRRAGAALVSIAEEDAAAHPLDVSHT